ncbi:MAG: glycosyltransferase, partial [Chloroflexota bacterium]
MVRILYLVPEFTHTPHEGHLVRYGQVREALRALGHSVLVHAPAARATSAGHRSARVSRWHRPIQLTEAAAWTDVRHAITHFEPDIVLATHPHFTDVTALGRRLGIPVVVETYNYEPGISMMKSLGRSPAAHVSVVLAEALYLRRAARVWTLSSEDKRSYARTYPFCSIGVVPHVIPLPTADAQTVSTASDILFVGSYGYRPNALAARFLLEQVMPILRSHRRGRAHLTFVGPEPPAWMRVFRADDVEITGAVADLSPYYRRANVVACPVNEGGGVKTKVLEAMAYGRPVVLTKPSCRGIAIVNGRDAVRADSNASAFAHALLQLLEYPDVAERIG